MRPWQNAAGPSDPTLLDCGPERDRDASQKAQKQSRAASWATLTRSGQCLFRLLGLVSRDRKSRSFSAAPRAGCERGGAKDGCPSSACVSKVGQGFPIDYRPREWVKGMSKTYHARGEQVKLSQDRHRQAGTDVCLTLARHGFTFDQRPAFGVGIRHSRGATTATATPSSACPRPLHRG